MRKWIILFLTGFLALSSVSFASTLEKTDQEDPLIKLSDEFIDGSSLARWKLHHEVEGWPSQIDVMDINDTKPGSLYLVPKTSTWYGDYRGIYLYNEVKGDFVVTTRLKVSGKRSERPTGIFELAGLLVRQPKSTHAATWTPGQENWMYLNYGTPEHTNEMVLDSKVNLKSQFAYEETPVATDWIQLKIARVGSWFFQFYKYDHDDHWTLHRRLHLPELPQTVQVGINTHGNTAKSFSVEPKVFNHTIYDSKKDRADLVAEFDYVRYQRPVIDDKLKAKLLKGEALDRELVKALAEKK